jgi:hypothetical protein
MKRQLPYLTRYLLLFIIAVLAFWQVAFMVYPVKYDMPDCYYPWRFLVGEILQSGELPLWNYYQLFGSPIHADPSSGAWYPVVWIIGFLKGYTLHALALELVFHIGLAGIGFFRLARVFNLTQNTSLLLAIAYMLSGFFVGNAQHITYIISACWIPFVLSYFIKLQRTLTIQHAAKTALALFMLITGGYPAFTVILIYFLGVLFLYFIIGDIKNKEFSQFRMRLGMNLLSAVFYIAAAAVMLVSVYGALPYITRTNGFQLQNALYGPFSVQSFLSFVFPFTSVDNDFIQTDMSMSNAYFGVLMVPVFILALIRKKTPLQKVFLGFGLFALAAAVGDALPVRAWLFEYFPAMNIFRFPSVFRIYVILSFLLVSGYTLQEILSDKYPLKIIAGLLLLFAAVLVISLGLFAYFSDPFSLYEFYQTRLFIRLEDPVMWNNMAVQAIPAGLFLLLAFGVLKLNISAPKRTFIWGSLLTADLVTAVQFNSPYTVFYKEFTGKESKAAEQGFTKGFPVPTSEPIGNKAPELVSGPFWKNLNIFKKQPSSDGMNNFIFTSTQNLIDLYPGELEKINTLPLVYLSHDIRSFKQFNTDRENGNIQPTSLYVGDKIFVKYKGTPADSAIRNEMVKIEAISPSSLTVQTQTSQAGFLTLLQSGYTGWEALVDGKETEIIQSNSLFMTVPVSSGKHTVQFVYRNKAVNRAFYLSAITVLMLLIIAFIPIKKSTV